MPDSPLDTPGSFVPRDLANVRPPIQPPLPQPAPDSDYGDAPAGVPLKHRLWVIRRNWPAIVGFAEVCTITTAIISYRITPIYDATATIDVGRRAPTGVVGQDANTNTASDTEQFLNTQ